METILLCFHLQYYHVGDLVLDTLEKKRKKKKKKEEEEDKDWFQNYRTCIFFFE